MEERTTSRKSRPATQAAHFRFTFSSYRESEREGEGEGDGQGDDSSHEKRVGERKKEMKFGQEDGCDHGEKEL